MSLNLKRCSGSAFDVRAPKRRAFDGLWVRGARGIGLELRIPGLGFRILGLLLRIPGLGLRIFGLGLLLLGLGCAVPVDPGGIGVGKLSALLKERAAQILAHAIRIRTVNPPGDEKPLAEYYVSLLQQAGIESRVIDTPTGASSVGRAAAWGRVRGSGDLPPLILLSHLDTVPADADAWQGEPFAGAREGDSIVGRGAVDAKGVGVVQLLTLIELSRREIPLARDIIFLATPDEEAGGVDGAGYVTRERTDLLAGARYLLTEGGGVTLGREGRPDIWGVAILEKSPCWLRVTASGSPGHSSGPPSGLAAAVPRLVAALERLRQHEFPIEVIPEVAAMYRAMAPVSPGPDRLGLTDLALHLGTDDEFRERFLARAYNSALVRTTLSITVLEGSPRTNMLPTEAVAHLDVRVLPGASCLEITETVRRVIDDPKIRVETLLSFPAKSSSAETDLFRAMGRVARQIDAEAIVVPQMIGGFTDAHYFRELGITAYGFVPRWFSPGEARGVHGPNERAKIENLGRGVETFISILLELDRLELAARSARTR